MHENLDSMPGVTVIYVMTANQINPKAERFVGEHGAHKFIFLKDPDHKVIDQFGIYNDKPDEEIERGVPHPTTYVLDRDGVIVLKDTRRNFQQWLSSRVLRNAIEKQQPQSGEGGDGQQPNP
ncbi:MAG: peroxiredoxin family protein [Candidatus Binataceae bacterium]